ncbi:hypothetical protein COS91_05750 [Candidatus Desantisbacteria bacterium CG07_land_8_20_14_0_80_39_15]|uniref:Uncharacterized protein n=2 Tax=unclassified Candidatus Desantisiibacteriota TaxID=3106372 RepID=A0A2H9PBP3_9BACT|nr:MAG: hypothetical protein COS91_05750 [Candidatus Desantisbacteria bacterium CG07_land_8_20_14_0_80_39_15]PIZ16365.1 MAG: hypothetical protein COY51_02975 [Candidatus Desantisbacteria bacterium CG_4_10_14_0_8_um_filter_39_17]
MSTLLEGYQWQLIVFSDLTRKQSLSKHFQNLVVTLDTEGGCFSSFNGIEVLKDKPEAYK